MIICGSKQREEGDNRLSSCQGFVSISLFFLSLSFYQSVSPYKQGTLPPNNFPTDCMCACACVRTFVYVGYVFGVWSSEKGLLLVASVAM